MASIGLAKAQIPPDAFFRQVRHRSIKKWHPQPTPTVAIAKKKPDKDDPTLGAMVKTAHPNTSITSSATTTKGNIIIFNLGTPSGIIIDVTAQAKEHPQKTDEAQAILPLEGHAGKHIMWTWTRSSLEENQMLQRRRKKDFETASTQEGSFFIIDAGADKSTTQGSPNNSDDSWCCSNSQ